MLIDYTNIINFITQFMYTAGPIAITLALVTKITNWFLDFVSGDRRVRL